MIYSSANEALIILGCHRSGTSALSSILNRAGYEVPGGEVDFNPSENPEGYFENRNIVQRNNQILSSLGLRWDSMVGVDKLLANSSVDSYNGLTMPALGRDFRSGLILIKDPRLSTLWPFWLDAFKQLNAQPKVIVAVRDPVNVAKSLNKRWQRSPRSCQIDSIKKGLEFWKIQTVGSIWACLYHRFYILNTDQFLSDPYNYGSELIKALDLKIGFSDLRDAVSYFEANIRRNDLYDKKMNDSDYGELAPFLEDLEALNHNLSPLEFLSRYSCI